jgi:hypothetical protein
MEEGGMKEKKMLVRKLSPGAQMQQRLVANLVQRRDERTEAPEQDEVLA